MTLSPQHRHRPAQRRRRSITNARNTVEERRFQSRVQHPKRNGASAPMYRPEGDAEESETTEEIVTLSPQHRRRPAQRRRRSITNARNTVEERRFQSRVQHPKRNGASAPMYRPEGDAEESETTEEIVTLSPQHRRRPAQRRRRSITNARNTVEERRFQSRVQHPKKRPGFSPCVPGFPGRARLQSCRMPKKTSVIPNRAESPVRACPERSRREPAVRRTTTNRVRDVSGALATLTTTWSHS